MITALWWLSSIRVQLGPGYGCCFSFVPSVMDLMERAVGRIKRKRMSALLCVSVEGRVGRGGCDVLEADTRPADRFETKVWMWTETRVRNSKTTEGLAEITADKAGLKFRPLHREFKLLYFIAFTFILSTVKQDGRNSSQSANDPLTTVTKRQESLAQECRPHRSSTRSG